MPVSARPPVSSLQHWLTGRERERERQMVCIVLPESPGNWGALWAGGPDTPPLPEGRRERERERERERARTT